MIAENVVMTTDYEGNKYYVPVDKLNEFDEWCESEPDSEFEHATLYEGELFVVNIVRKV